jgi:hypothetical protein
MGVIDVKYGLRAFSWAPCTDAELGTLEQDALLRTRSSLFLTIKFMRSD